MLRKLKGQILAVRYNWCQGPVPGRSPAVEKQYYRVHMFRRDTLQWVCLGGNFCSKRRNIKIFVLFIINFPNVAAGSLPSSELMPKPTIGNIILSSFCLRAIFTISLPQIHLLLLHIPFRLLCNFMHLAFHVPLSYLLAQPIVTI